MEQFSTIIEFQGYDDEEAAVILFSKLEGDARSVAASLRDQSLGPICDALRTNFSHNQQKAAKLKLRGRKQKPGENFDKLSFEIKQLTRKAYPGSDEKTKNMLALETYMGAISDIKVKEKLMDRDPQTMDEAVQESYRLSANKELISKEKAEKSQKAEKVGNAAVKKIRDQLRQMKMGDPAPTKTPRREPPKGLPKEDGNWKRRSPSKPPTCWKCLMEGHVSRWCPFTERTIEELRRKGELPLPKPENEPGQRTKARESLS